MDLRKSPHDRETLTMDSCVSPYLEAIQAVPGSTPGQKYRELNRAAREAAANAKSHGDVAIPVIGLNDIPEPLAPLVRLETAKILRQNEIVVESLESEDREIVDRALRIDWFFRAENKEVINVEYFKTHLYPTISLDTRIKVIKKLSASLSACGATSLAESFYGYTSRSYGTSQASPLLRACSESFIWDTIIQSKLVLTCRLTKILFDKYPELVVRYLKLSKPNGTKNDARNLHRVCISQYNYFLPRLIKNHLTSLIELIETHDSCFGIELSNKATERFLKSNVEVVLDRPILYTSMMPLKVIAAKITKSQYRSMFARVYPPKCEDFQYRNVKKYLAYYPEQERISLLLETYEKIYNADMLDNHDVVNEEILQMLPQDERVRQARAKLEKEPDWRKTSNVEKMWRCYLPLQETLAAIKMEISKTSLANERSTLLRQMFYVCRVNDDKDALVQVLQYFTSRHRNEQSYVIFDALDSLARYFDMATLGKDHWSVIDEFIKFLHTKNELEQRSTTSLQILTASVYFKLAHDLPLDESLGTLIDINMKRWNASWCIFEKHPEYDRICFERMMSIVPQRYPKDHQIWKNYGLDLYCDVVKSMHAFNERNSGKGANSKMEKLLIKKYTWLAEGLEKKVKAEIKDEWKLDIVIKFLKTWEIDLYVLWIPTRPDEISDVKSGEALKLLKEDAHKILERYEAYLYSIMMSVNSETRTQRFVKACRWYQDIPIKFLSQCTKSLKGETSGESLMVLGILMEGPSFSRIIEPLVPKGANRVDTISEGAKSSYSTISAIPRAMNLVNPPVSLAFVMKFCNGDFLNLGLITLTSVTRRTNVHKVEEFAKRLSDLRVSVRKHGIRLYCMVATIPDYRDFLSTLWRAEAHRSIREVIFKRIYELFVNDACPENWTMLRDCMGDLRVDDDDILDYIGNLDAVPDSRIGEYVPLLFESLERLVANGFDATRMADYLCRFLARITTPISKLLSDQFSQHLFQTYFCKPELSTSLANAGMRYTLDAYLRADATKLVHRLKTFGCVYEDILKKYWNQPDSRVPTYFPVNRMIHKFVHEHVFYAGNDNTNVEIMKTILRSHLAVLRPQHDWSTYALLTYGIALEGTKDAREIAEKVRDTLPSLVQVLSPVLVIEFASIVKKWMNILVDEDKLDDALYQLIGILCDKSTSDSCTLAAKLLFRSSDRRHDTRYNEILRFLQNSEYSVAVSLACDHANTSE